MKSTTEFCTFEVSADMLPADWPQHRIDAAQLIITILFTGWQGSACFGDKGNGRRITGGLVKKRVMKRNPRLTGSVREYNIALSWLLENGVINAYKESSNPITYALTSTGSQVTQKGSALHYFVVEKYHKKRQGVF